MTKNWIVARDSYDYSRYLSHYAYRPEYPKQVRGYAETVEFEDLFRKYGPNEIKAWYAVVRWKSPRSTDKTINHIMASGVSAGELWGLCEDCVQNSTLDNFSRFRSKLAQTDIVATAATFPAFMCPEQFPMVDTRIAAWSRVNGTRHCLLAAPPGAEQGVHEWQNHWRFVQDWINWCRRMAKILCYLTGEPWRARDVEMAVFTAQGSKGKISLNPLTNVA